MSNESTQTVSKRELVKQWVSEHPDGTQRDCTEATGVSKSYISRIWDDLHPGRTKAHSGGKKRSAQISDRDQNSARTERVTVVLTPSEKQRLNIICAVSGQSISDWTAAHIAADYPKVSLPD